ncbi:MAG: type II secretion system protein GspC [Gammaproteobacteria bacterium]|nr:type II secretion system protein GspC [Gammaproteobacteria bacterium]
MQSSSTKIVADLNTRLLPMLNALVQSPQVATKVASIISVILVIMLAIKLADITWGFFPIPMQTSSNSSSQAPVTMESVQAQSSLASIPRLHLFGEAAKDAGNQKSKGPINAPDTKLRLVLHGVFASNEPSQSMAIIAPKSGKDKTYRIGESVPGGAQLHEVYADRIILSRNGQLETLRLIRARADIKIDKSNAAKPGSGKTSVRRSSRISQFKQSLKQNPQSLLKQIRISPVTSHGQIEGYRFSHNDQRLMRDLGLQPQDIITSINGISVTDNSSIFALMNDIGSMQELNLTLRRNKNTENVTIRFD